MTIKSGIGYGPLTDRVYYGRQNRAKCTWVGKKEDITNAFIGASLQYFELNTIREIGVEKDLHLIIHIKNDKASIKKLIRNLTKRLGDPNGK